MLDYKNISRIEGVSMKFSVAKKIGVLFGTFLIFLSTVLVLFFVFMTGRQNKKVVDEFHNRLMLAKRERLNNVLNTMYTSLTSQLDMQSSEISEAERLIIAKMINNTRFEEGNPDSYFYIHDSKGIVLAHGATPENVRKSEWDLKNKKGYYIVRGVIESAKTGDGYTVFDGWKPSKDAFFPKMTYSKYIKEKDMILTTGFYIDDVEFLTQEFSNLVNESMHSMLIKTLIFVIVIGLIFFAVLILVAKKIIIAPITTLSSLLKNISEGDGDLTQRIPVNGNDEIADMAKYFNLTIEKIGDSIKNVDDSTDKMSQIGIELASNVSETASSIQEINSNIEGVKQQTVNQSASVTETASTMEEIIRTIRSLNAGIENTVASVAQSSSSIEQITANIVSITQMLTTGDEAVVILD